VGDTAARAVADDQPAKFAAFECVYKSGDDQPEHIGGICHDGKVSASISIPGLDSLLVGFSTGTHVTGLDQFPRTTSRPPRQCSTWPSTRWSGWGSALFLLAVWFAIAWYRKRDLPATPWFLRAGAVAGVGAVLALESGWIVTEVGRQPWIVYGFMRTADAVTPARGIWWAFGLTMSLYIALGVVTVVVLRGMSRRWREGSPTEPGTDAPYGPPPPEPSEASP